VECCDAIVQAWYPGQEGGTAIADVLFGDYNPGGKLPVTFYESSSQLPDYEDYSMKGRTYRYFTGKALFPFGYGLSYTTFKVDGGQLNIDKSGKGTLTVDVTNTGQRDGEEVVQLYIRNLQDADGPIKSLRGFQRVSVKVGQTQKVTLELSPKSFEFFDTATNTMRVKPGRYELYYGNSSEESDLKRLETTL
jgi:beta-glucosidase